MDFRRIVSCIALLVALIILVGCSNGHVIVQNDRYTITHGDDDISFLNFKEGNEITTRQERIIYPTFSSLSEMQHAIKNNEFSEDEINVIKSFAQSTEQGIEICNVNNLYEPVLPSDVAVRDVVWYGASYIFESSSNIANGYFAYMQEEEYNSRFSSDYTNLFSRASINVTAEETDPDRNAVITYFTTSAGALKSIRYVVSDGNTTLHIDECYRLDMFNDQLPVSETVPNYIEIWGTKGNVHFYCYMNTPAFRPSLEWISCWGIREFNNGETS